VTIAPVPAALFLAGAAVAVLLADSVAGAGALSAALLAVVLRAPASRRRPYLAGAVVSGLGVFVVSPFVQSTGFHVIWSGPIVPVLGSLDVTREELVIAAVNALRLVGVSLAAAAYALLVDHDRLLAAAGFARRSAFTAVLATRLLPTLERDAAGLAEAVRGRGLAVAGVRGHARLLSPLVAGSLERAQNLAEAMETRGFSRAGRTRAPAPPWQLPDYAVALAGGLLVVAGALWL
jgi:energy-coupling factor transport system permease protein